MKLRQETVDTRGVDTGLGEENDFVTRGNSDYIHSSKGGEGQEKQAAVEKLTIELVNGVSINNRKVSPVKSGQVGELLKKFILEDIEKILLLPDGNGFYGRSKSYRHGIRFEQSKFALLRFT